MLTFVDGVTRVSTHVAVHARDGKLTFILVEKAGHLRPVGQQTDSSDAEQNGGDSLQSQRFRVNNVQECTFLKTKIHFDDEQNSPVFDE